MVSEGGYVVHEAAPLSYLVEAGLVRRSGKTVEVDPDARKLISNLIGQLSEFEEDEDADADLPTTEQPKPGREKE
jgi:hypothetical protein